MATFEAYLEALKTLQAQSATESLTPKEGQKTEYHYGFVCGIQQGLRMSEELLNKQLEEVEEDGIEPRRNQANRRRPGT